MRQVAEHAQVTIIIIMLQQVANDINMLPCIIDVIVGLTAVEHNACSTVGAEST